MAVLHQKVNAVLLGRDGVLGADDLDTLQVTDIYLDAAGDTRRPLVGAHRTRDDERRFPGQVPGGLKDLLADRLLEDDALDDTRAIADLQELQAALAGPGIEPALDRHFLAHRVPNALPEEWVGQDWSDTPRLDQSALGAAIIPACSESAG